MTGKAVGKQEQNKPGGWRRGKQQEMRKEGKQEAVTGLSRLWYGVGNLFPVE